MLMMLLSTLCYGQTIEIIDNDTLVNQIPLKNIVNANLVYQKLLNSNEKLDSATNQIDKLEIKSILQVHHIELSSQQIQFQKDQIENLNKMLNISENDNKVLNNKIQRINKIKNILIPFFVGTTITSGGLLTLYFLK